MSTAAQKIKRGENGPNEHACLGGRPLSKPPEVALECGDENISLRFVERTHVLCMFLESVVAPATNERMSNNTGQARSVQVGGGGLHWTSGKPKKEKSSDLRACQ
jgi:hypothetical protein